MRRGGEKGRGREAMIWKVLHHYANERDRTLVWVK